MGVENDSSFCTCVQHDSKTGNWLVRQKMVTSNYIFKYPPQICVFSVCCHCAVMLLFVIQWTCSDEVFATRSCQKTRNKIRREKKWQVKKNTNKTCDKIHYLSQKIEAKVVYHMLYFDVLGASGGSEKRWSVFDTKYSFKSHWFDRFGGPLASYMDVYVFHRSLKKLIIVHTISTSVARPYKENNCLLHSMLKQLSMASTHICSIQYLCTWFSLF